MNIVRVNNGNVELRKDNGVLIRRIGHGNAIFADISGDQAYIVITTTRGDVELYKENGVELRVLILSDAVNARFTGEDIMINKKNGRTRIVGMNGSVKREF